tara:strand:+ start:549 stop:3290 length:2742 start_codon:yes stop_codon:yes gene_type:complete
MFQKTAISLAITCCFVTSATAQEAQRVEVTGSSIKRINAESALPVQTVTRADIDRSGAQSVTELLQNLPAMQGFTHATQSVGASGGGFSGASIHNVGETRTLVLLNGRRMASWAGQTLTGQGAAFDLNSIPLAAVERIEVLSDGASAIYGTDAIAGVVNFILRRDLTTGEASVSASRPRGGVGQSTTVSLTKGWGRVEEDGYNALFSLAMDRQKQVKASDREFARTGVIPFSYQGKNLVFFNGSLRAAPGNYEIVNDAREFDSLGNHYYDQNGRCPPVHVYRGGACRFDFTSTLEILPEQSRDSFFASVSKSLGGDHKLSVDFAYNRFSLTSRIAPPPVDMRIPTGSALYNRYMPGGTDVLDPTSVYGDDLFAYWRGVDVGNRITKDDTKATHLAFSLSGSLSGWDYSSALTLSRNKWVESHGGGWLLQNELDSAIANGSFNPFLLPGEQSAEGIAALGGMQHRGEYKSQTSTLTALEWHASREVFKIGNRSAQLGLGADFRREEVDYRPSAVARGIVNNIAGDSAQELPYDVTRKVWGVYGELVLPVLPEVEINAALRHDHYSDFGNTDNGKLSVRYQPTKSLLLRGSVGSGYRAPSVPQVAAGRQLYGVTGGTYTCPTEALEALRATDATVRCRPSEAQYDIVASGTSDLKPEKSNQWTLGFRVEPTNDLSLGADFWGVNVKDRILQLKEDVVMSDPGSYLKNFTTFKDPGTGQNYVALYLPNENLGKERFLGVDLDARAGFGLGFGRLTTAVQWTHLFKYDYQRMKDGAWYSNLGKFNDDAVTFKNLVKLTAVLKSGQFENTVVVSYKSSYTDQVCTAADCGLVRVLNPDGTIGALVDVTDRRVASYTTVDLQSKVEVTKAWTATFGVNNLFERDPPLTLKTTGGHQLGYDNRYTDARGRTLYARANFKF